MSTINWYSRGKKANRKYSALFFEVFHREISPCNGNESEHLQVISYVKICNIWKARIREQSRLSRANKYKEYRGKSFSNFFSKLVWIGSTKHVSRLQKDFVKVSVSFL